MSFLSSLFSIVIIPLISLSGVAAGVLLSYLAQEELAAGKKYFIMMYKVIFILLSSVITYFLYFLSFRLLALFLFFAITLFLLDLKKPSYTFLYAYSVHYFLFLISYFLSSKQLIIAAILFLYGLPVGTLLRVRE